MGLDVYVGSLTRYYSGNWETIVQQAGREQGLTVTVVRPGAAKSWLGRLLGRFRPSGEASAAEAVRRWRDRVGGELGIAGLEWNEAPDAEYATDKPAWDCYGALALWASYDELPRAPRRETAEGWDQDSALLTSRMNPKSRYRHLVADTEIWLPVAFEQPLRTDALTGDSVVVGSSVRLLEELRELNDRTWAADDDRIAKWRYDGAEYGAPLEISARFGFSIFYDLTRRSVAARLPMKLDY